jgi:hypothetical protein
MRGKAVTVNVRMPKAKGRKRSRRGPYQSLKSTGWRRGTPESIAQFGATYRQATPDQLAMRRNWNYTGNGMYRGRGGFFGDLWNKVKDVYSSPVGTQIRSAIGGGLRSGVLGPKGMLAGQAMSAMGIGDYDVSSGQAPVVTNDIVDGGVGQGVPSFGPSGANTVTITHKEYICDIFGPEQAGTFANQTFSLNPALASTFPWLAQVAANYDEYTFGQLMFTFRSTVTDFVATNGQVGTVILATQYNADDTPFQSKQDAMEYDGAVSGKCSQEIIAGVECDPAQNSGSYGKYTRAGPVPEGQDVKTYDLGTLNVGVSNTPGVFSNQALGELWVSYTVQLRKPKFFVTRGLSLATDVFVGKGTSSVLNAMTIGEGQQNRIGTKLLREYDSGPTNYPVNPQRLYLVFPPSFSGDVDIQLISVCPTVGTTLCVLGASNPGTGIKPINDIWGGSGTGAWQQNYGFNGNSATTLGPACTGAHFRITSPSTAQTNTAEDNVITLGATATLDAFTIYVKFYNTGMNYSRIDQPVIQNPQTGLTEPWP